MNPFLLLLVSYLLGAIPTSFWVGKFFHGVDLRTAGSGNLGATNTYRVLGWKAALPVLVVDVTKGWLPVWLFPVLDAEGAAWSWALAYGAMAIVGHVFSVWVRFRGGKGVATSAGVFLALAPWGVLVGLLVFAVTVAATRLVSLGSILAALSLPAAVVWLPSAGPPGARPTLLWFTTALAIFVVWAHRSNLRRILRGQEPRIDRERRARAGVERQSADVDPPHQPGSTP